MGKFDTLLKTKESKRIYHSMAEEFYEQAFSKGTSDYVTLENSYVQKLQEANLRKKFQKDLVFLWGQLEMKSYIDFHLGNTPNLYYINCSKEVPVKNLVDYNYMKEQARLTSLLDIKYIKHFELESLSFDEIYLATFEIMDPEENYRPYVLLYTKNEKQEFVQFAYGYDSNDNGNVELFIPSFNYPVFLTPKGILSTSLSNKRVKLNVYDYFTFQDLQKIEQKKKAQN